MSQQGIPEERQRLLGEEAGRESGDEQLLLSSAPVSQPTAPPPNIPQEPPPVYSPPAPAAPAIIVPTPVPAHPQPPPPMVSAQIPVTVSDPKPAVGLEAPPEYTFHVPHTHHAAPMPAGSAGLPVQVQVDGRMLSATLIQDAYGKHMVYIGDSEQTSSGLTPDGRPKPPKDYLGLALFSLLCCCFPFGVIALIKSMEVQRRYNQGDYTGAQRASRLAYKWGSAAIMFGVTFLVIFVALKLYFEDHHVRRYYY